MCCSVGLNVATEPLERAVQKHDAELSKRASVCVHERVSDQTHGFLLGLVWKMRCVWFGAGTGSVGLC